MRDLVLGVDCSTTAAKVVAWDRGGKARVEGRASFEEIRPQPGYSEQRANAVADPLEQLLRRRGTGRGRRRRRRDGKEVTRCPPSEHHESGRAPEVKRRSTIREPLGGRGHSSSPEQQIEPS
jgi:hypothetical protein